jgi:pSer/pThr/pTyr-binding forkhead associated (FHA) protein
MEEAMLKILLTLKGKDLKTLDTDKTEITIGRNENNDIQINNLGASKKHARIVKQNGQYIIEDLNSTNGTLLNNESIIKARLKSKDVVTIGKHNLFISIREGRDATMDVAEATIKISS